MWATERHSIPVTGLVVQTHLSPRRPPGALYPLSVTAIPTKAVWPYRTAMELRNPAGTCEGTHWRHFLRRKQRDPPNFRTKPQPDGAAASERESLRAERASLTIDDCTVSPVPGGGIHPEMGRRHFSCRIGQFLTPQRILHMCICRRPVHRLSSPTSIPYRGRIRGWDRSCL